MEEFEPQYPAKPELLKRNREGHISITILSIVVFAITFYFIFSDYFLIALLLFVLIFHELGHFVFMKLFNYKQLNMLFVPFVGALVSGHKKKYSQIEGGIMVLAGPLPGIVLGATLILYNWLEPNNLSIQLGTMLIMLNVMNLIPVNPLDGGKLMQILFFGKFELVQLILTILISFIVIGVGIYVNSWLVVAFGFIIGFQVKNQHKLYLIRKELVNEEVQIESNYDDLTDKTFWQIKNVLMNHTTSLKDLDDLNDVDNRIDQIFAKQVASILYPPTKKDASFAFTFFLLTLWLGGILLSIFAMLSIDLNTVINAFQYR
ncbi:MAG: hypothetical protein WC994_00270 [Brumimicrobium sp.]